MSKQILTWTKQFRRHFIQQKTNGLPWGIFKYMQSFALSCGSVFAFFL
jgi:hypothetical protein